MKKCQVSLMFIVLLVLLFSFISPVYAVYPKKAPAHFTVHSLAASEYPSWSTYFVGHMYGIIDGRKGYIGPIEDEWQVDMELKEAEYDPCIIMYGSGQCDAVCITNMDALKPSLSRTSIAILPTSTSYGGDRCIVVKSKVSGIEDLRGLPVYGLEKSVSPYCQIRNLELRGEDLSKHIFQNMDPGAAAMAMQGKQKGIYAINVWNPFALQTLNTRSDVYVIFDSRSIPAEIIDMVVIAESSLKKQGGENFACAVIDTFYAVNKLLRDSKTRDDATVALGEKFSNLNLASMRTVLKQTVFYKTPAQAIALFTNGEAFPGGAVATDGNLEQIMNKHVVRVCKIMKMLSDNENPKIGYGNEEEAKKVDLRFDPTYIKRVAYKLKK